MRSRAVCRNTIFNHKHTYNNSSVTVSIYCVTEVRKHLSRRLLGYFDFVESSVHCVCNELCNSQNNLSTLQKTLLLRRMEIWLFFHFLRYDHLTDILKLQLNLRFSDYYFYLVLKWIELELIKYYHSHIISHYDEGCRYDYVSVNAMQTARYIYILLRH